MSLGQNIMRFGVYLLAIYLPFSFFSFDTLNVKAVNEVEIIVGNHGHGQQTNMIIKVVLGQDLLCSGYVDVQFSENIMPTVFTADDVNVMHLDAGGPGVDESAYMVFYSGATDGNRIAFDRGGTGCTTISAGETIAYYLGPQDDPVVGYETGVEDVEDDLVSSPNVIKNFNDAAVNLITNPVSGDNVGFHTVSSYSGNNNIEGFYPLVDDGTHPAVYGSEYDVNVDVSSHISLSITDSELDFGYMEPGFITGDTAGITVSTNYRKGYALRYRATEFTNGTSTFSRSSGGALSEGDWGINLVDNTASSVDIGSYPNTIDGNVYSNDNLGVGGSGTNYGIMTAYGIVDNYKVDTVNTLVPIIINNGPTNEEIVLSAAVYPSSAYSTGIYRGTITVNIYANF